MEKNRLLARASIVAFCGFCVTAISGYTSLPMLVLLSGIVLLLGALAIAIFVVTLARGKIFGPSRRKPESGMFRDSVRALLTTIALCVLATISGYMKNVNHAGLALGLGLCGLISVVYWVLAILNFRRARQKEPNEP